MTLSEMRRLLDEHGIQLTRSLGQNFLHDANQLKRIVALAEIKPEDRVLEIGPGLGPLTEALLSAGANVLAIEKDARLAELLRLRLASATRLTLEHADAMDVVTQPRDWRGWSLVANLPYSVASPLLVELASASLPPERLVATLQLEVARRLMAKANDDDYGLLTLLIQLRYEPVQLFRIPAGCFFPAPDVESGCIRLDRRKTELLPESLHTSFRRIVRRAFSQRRKMMMKLLRQDWPGEVLESAYAALAISPGLRAEAVTLEQFGRLTELLAASLAR